MAIVQRWARNGDRFNPRRHCWARQDIAEIAPVWRATSAHPDILRPVLELRETCGKRNVIAQADPFTLRYLATLLRDRLGAPARPAVRLLPLDPTDPDWHVCDFPPIAPHKCRWLVNPTTDGGVVVHSPPRGFAAPEIRRLFLVLGAILAACVLAAVFVPPVLSATPKTVAASPDWRRSSAASPPAP